MADRFTVHELAQLVGMTTRNIRAYQSRGLLHPPDIRGRVAYYNGSHLARLGLVTSLQREGFTLAAIQRLIDTPHSYAAIVADRRRRFREDESDIIPTVPLPVEQVRHAVRDLPDDLTETGLVWREGDQLVTHTMLMGIGRTLAAAGVPVSLLTLLQLEAAKTARKLGQAVHDGLRPNTEDGRYDDLSKVAVQLAAAAFEIAFLEAARGRVTADGATQPSEAS